MIYPPVPLDEVERLAALYEIGVLDTPTDAGIDSLTRYVAKLWDVPMAAVSLIDERRQWFKSSVGLKVKETPRSMSFCAHMLIHPGEPLIVEDAQRDIRFADNPLVTGDPKIRFYAGAALRDDKHHVLGALCVFDRKQRVPSPAQIYALKELATAVSGALVLHRAVHQLEHLVATDPLTGVLNRKGLDSYLARLANHPLCVMLFDLDGFKAINDGFGHAVGDKALQEVACRMRTVVRHTDALARLGGDEFAIVLPSASSCDEGLLVADRVHRLLAEPFMTGSTPIALATSVGIACRPLHATDTSDLFRMADIALYAAKAAGCSTSRVAAGRVPTYEKGRLGRTTLVDHLTAAVHAPDGAFSLRYQPIFNVLTGEVRSVEALVRWSFEGTEISPAIFIPLAESLGLVPSIDRFVLRAASEAAKTWPVERRLSVNFSALSFGLPELEAIILNEVEATGFSHSRLTIELTETALSTMPKKLFSTLERLVACGFSIALDDFGAGQTSLMQLRRLPIRTLKIDRGLVHDAAMDSRGISILTAIAELGIALGIIVVAEGIETEAELELVKSLRIPRAQGFLLAAPVDLHDLEESIDAGRKRLQTFPLSSPRVIL